MNIKMNKLGQILSSKLLVITISLINVIISGFSDVAAARVSAPSSRSRVTAPAQFTVNIAPWCHRAGAGAAPSAPSTWDGPQSSRSVSAERNCILNENVEE